MTDPSGPDPIEAAARFVAMEPGWTDRVLAQHTARENGDCAGCGTYRPERWPCTQLRIANRALEITRAAETAERRDERASQQTRAGPANKVPTAGWHRAEPTAAKPPRRGFGQRGTRPLSPLAG